MRPAVAVPFRTGDGFRFLVPGKHNVEGRCEYSGEIVLVEGRHGCFSDHIGLSDSG